MKQKVVLKKDMSGVKKGAEVAVTSEKQLNYLKKKGFVAKEEKSTFSTKEEK